MGHPITRNNAIEHRYELIEEEKLLGFADYRLAGDAVKFTHTEIMPENEGKGYGSLLAKQALDDVRERKKRVIPACSFIAGFIRKHAEYSHLLAPEN
jgi:predicted GNAT family acetyltransferase